MDLFEAMNGRRSIRRYLDRPVPDEVVRRVLEAARCAPSWANTQCWRFVVVRDAATKKLIADATPSSNPAHKALTEAPVLVAACFAKDVSGWYKGKPATMLGDWGMFDLGIAVSQLTLAAHALGLGTVHVGLLDHARVAEILGLPPSFQLVEVLPLGYPDQAPKSPKRKAVDEFARWDRWT